MTQRIAVLMGGTTGERAVSLASGAEIVAALTRLGHEVMTVDLDAAEGGLVGSAHAPQWRVGPVGKPSWQGTAAAALEGPLAQVNVFFLGLHGGFGEGGPLQGLLEACGRAFTGSGLAASSLCLDKVLTLLLAESLGLRTARRVVQAPVLSASGARVGVVHGIAATPRGDGDGGGEDAVSRDGERVGLDRWFRRLKGTRAFGMLECPVDRHRSLGDGRDGARVRGARGGRARDRARWTTARRRARSWTRRAARRSSSSSTRCAPRRSVKR